MRNIPAPVGALFISLAALAALLSVSCGTARRGSLALSDGAEIRWTPVEPKIGDLVTLESIAGKASGADGNAAPSSPSAGTVRDPSGSAIEPVAAVFAGAGGSRAAKTIRWSFRVTSAGSWTIDDGDTRQTLWNAATVAGKESDLKKFDGDSLWRGSKPKAQPSGPAATPASAAHSAQGVAPTNVQGVSP